mgnify:CR=1 FL=1
MKKFILCAIASLFSVSLFAQSRVVQTAKRPTGGTVVNRPNTQAECATDPATGIFTCKTSGSKTTGKTTLGGNSNVNKPVVNTPNPKTSICATNDDGIFTCKPKNKRDVKKIKRDAQSNYNNAKNKAANAFK